MAFVTTTTPDLYATTSNLEEIPAGADPLQYMDDDKANQILAGLTALHGWASGVPVSETANGHFLALAAGSSAAVSIAGGVRIRQSSGALDYSYNTGAYARLLSKLTLASQATGDIMYASAADTWTRLAAGTDGHVLTLAGGVPTWAAAGGGGGIAAGDNVTWTGNHAWNTGTAAFANSLGVTGTLTVTGGATISTILGLAAGAVGAPSLYATGDTNTGLYFPAADQVALTTAGTARLLIDGSTELHSLIQTGPVGSASLPTYGFTGDPNTGAYNIGADQYGITAGGTLRLTVSTTGVTSTLPVLGPNGSAAAPAFGFSGDAGEGMYLSAANTVAMAAAGALAQSWSATAAITYIGGAVRSELDDTGLSLTGSSGATVNGDVNVLTLLATNTGTTLAGFSCGISFEARNAAAGTHGVAAIYGRFTDPADTTEDAELDFYVASGGGTPKVAILTGVGAWQVGAGSASLPSLTFTGDTNTGFYSSGADEMTFTFGGTARIRSDGSRTVWTYGGATADTPGFMAEWKTDAAEGRIKVRSSNTGGYGGFYAIGSDANKVLSMSMYSASAAGTACGVSYASLAEIVSVAANMVIYTTGAQRVVFGTNNTNTFELGSTVSTIGFFGVTPSARAAAYTQTYSTAARTVTSGMTVDQLAQIVNSLIDDLQAYGLVQ